MKKIVKVLMFLSLAALKLNSQTITYKIVKDDPKDIANFSCNLDFFQFDVGFGQIDGVSFNLGAWGHVMYKQIGGIDYTLRYGYLTFSTLFGDGKALGKHINAQTGVFYIFHKKEKPSKERVVVQAISEEYEGKTYHYNKSLSIDNYIGKYKALRGGLYFNRGIADVYKKSILSVSGPLSNYFILGLYGGICFGTTKNIGIVSDKIAESGEARHNRFILDILFTPVQNTGISINPFGGRLVYQMLPAISKKERRKGGYSILSRMALEFECGYRPVDGVFLAFTWSIPIARKLSVLGPTTSEPVRTSE
ncbi:MAG: hypothetical protein N3F09_06020 [Bacteroidia bacterium]|nr:hypothetical protein [Bacteroidia bacterium]